MDLLKPSKENAANNHKEDKYTSAATVTNSPSTSKPAEKPKSNRPKLPVVKQGTLRVVLLVVIVLLVGFIGGWLGAAGKIHDSTSVENKTNEAKQQIVLNESSVISQIAKDVGPSVVSVEVTSAATQQDFFGNGRQVEQQSAGTGFIVSADGVIVTNRHVVPAGTTTVSVTLSDGTKLDSVDVLGRTSANDSLDIAFLKVKDKKGKTLVPVKLADSSKTQVGDRVIAIGNALGQFQNTVTSGIISGYGRSITAGDESGGESETLQNLFQTDAAINQGNSGGPLVNVNGEVIAINTAIAGSGAENIGFAIPINDAKGLIKSALEKGKIERPYLGVRYVSLTDDIAYTYNLPVKRGAYIAPGSGQNPVLPGSPAEKAGLKEKDIIVKVDGQAVDENHSLTSILGQKNVGDNVTLTIYRDGKEQTVTAKLEAAPQS